VFQAHGEKHRNRERLNLHAQSQINIVIGLAPLPREAGPWDSICINGLMVVLILELGHRLLKAVDVYIGCRITTSTPNHALTVYEWKSVN